MPNKEMMDRLREFLSRWGFWTSSELEQVAKFMEDNAELLVRPKPTPEIASRSNQAPTKTISNKRTDEFPYIDRSTMFITPDSQLSACFVEIKCLRKKLAEAETVIAGCKHREQSLSEPFAGLGGISPADKELAGLVSAAESRPGEGTRQLPSVGEKVSCPHPKTGFGLYPDQVAEHSADGQSFRCVSTGRVWYRLEDEWRGPFDAPRPIGKIWKRGLPSEE